MRIKKGDTVLIISGKDKNKKGKILKSFPKDNKILVEGINLHKKHQRPKRSGQKGQIVELPLPLNVSKVKFVCSKCGQGARVGFKIEAKNKYRICKKCGEII